MNPQRLSVRFRVEDAPDNLDPAIGLFHRFIQKGAVEGQILDVADYRHVPDGPGVLLVGHDVDYGINRSAFSVLRKRSAQDPTATQLRDALRMGLGAVEAMSYDGGLRVAVDRSRFTVTAVDRNLGAAPEAEAVFRAQVEPVVSELFGPDATVTATEVDDPRRPPELVVEANPGAAGEVLEKLGGSQAPGQSPWDLTVEELARLRDSEAPIVLLDVREDTERNIVHIGGEHIPLADLDDHLDGLDRGAQIVTYCRAGLRAPKAVDRLRDAGFEDVWNVNGGLMAWIDRIDPSLPRY
ncbi:MAG: rhodanese-like domain-containing protein [Nitriliruptorales bacterium]|nr:rhodanese-like domain-containing protein [Nitriliruptorales bacterium]